MKQSIRWTPEEHEVVASDYPSGDLTDLSKRLGRSIVAIKRYAQSKKIRRRVSTKGRKYTQRNPRPRVVVEKPYRALEEALRGWRQ